MNRTLQGKAVFIVEDDELSALTIKDFVEGLGCQVIGHARTLDEALTATEHADIDIALLDVDLQGERSYAVAEGLAGRHVPFVFTTGTTETGPEWCKDRPRVLKPFSGTSLERIMVASLGEVA
jgi:DNA-binding NarL/FixJ family response regulator